MHRMCYACKILYILYISMSLLGVLEVWSRSVNNWRQNAFVHLCRACVERRGARGRVTCREGEG